MWPLLETNFASGRCVTGLRALSQWVTWCTWESGDCLQGHGKDWKELGAYGNKASGPGFWLSVDPFVALCLGRPVPTPATFVRLELSRPRLSPRGPESGVPWEVSSCWSVHLIAKGGRRCPPSRPSRPGDDQC